MTKLRMEVAIVDDLKNELQRLQKENDDLKNTCSVQDSVSAPSFVGSKCCNTFHGLKSQNVDHLAAVFLNNLIMTLYSSG